MAKLPLEGITVLDFGWVVADPHGSRLLQTLGATVIRVESAARPDFMRLDTMRTGNKNPFAEGGWGYQENNRNKICLNVSLKSEAGMKIVHELVKKVDIVTCNASPRAFHKMGIDYESLKSFKEDIIVLNASGVGDTGPYSGYGAYAPTMAAACGVTALIGYEGKAPFGYNGLFCDYTGGTHLAAAVLGALIYRKRTGKGQFIDLAQTEAAMANLAPAIINNDVNGVCAGSCGNHHYAHQMAPHNCYLCDKENTWCVIAVGSEEEWSSLCGELRNECPWVDDPKFATMEGRLANEAELDANLAAWTAKNDYKAIAKRLQSAGVSAGMVQNSYDFTHDEHAKARGYFKKVNLGDHLDPPYFLVTGDIINLASAPKTDECKPGPGIGQDNEYILKTYLGMTDEEIQAAEAQGAFAAPPPKR